MQISIMFKLIMQIAALTNKNVTSAHSYIYLYAISQQIIDFFACKMPF